MKRYIYWLSSIFCALFVFTSVQTYAESHTAGAVVSDSVITTKIKSQFAANSVINPFNISVTTNNGIVTLSGTVNSETEASTAVQIAESTKGVKDVDASNLKQKENADQPMTDAYITAKVNGVFIRERLFNSDLPVFPIKVETKNGVVYLSGNVDHASQAERAVELAKQVKGVTEVKSTIQVGKE